jgi:hypothetical protein
LCNQSFALSPTAIADTPQAMTMISLTCSDGILIKRRERNQSAREHQNDKVGGSPAREGFDRSWHAGHNSASMPDNLRLKLQSYTSHITASSWTWISTNFLLSHLFLSQIYELMLGKVYVDSTSIFQPECKLNSLFPQNVISRRSARSLPHS